MAKNYSSDVEAVDDLVVTYKKLRNEIGKIARKSGLFLIIGRLRGLGRLDGGRTKARTWDPMIKSHLLTIEIISAAAALGFGLARRYMPPAPFP